VSQQFFNDLQGEKKVTVLCQFPEDKIEKGRWKVTVISNLNGIKSVARLTRLFVGSEITEQRKNELLALHNLNPIEASRGAEEFAMLTIGIGTPPTTPILDDSAQQLLIGNIENKADGEIVNIKNAEIELIKGVGPTETCFNSFDLTGNILTAKKEYLDSLKSLDKYKKGDKVFLVGCNLDVSSILVPEEYDEYFKREFTSSLEYDYKISKSGVFEVISNV
jgi:hypothetical protein